MGRPAVRPAKDIRKSRERFDRTLGFDPVIRFLFVASAWELHHPIRLFDQRDIP